MDREEAIWPNVGERVLWTAVVILVTIGVFSLLIYSFFSMFAGVKPHPAEEHVINLLQTNINAGLNVVTGPHPEGSNAQETTTTINTPTSITHALPTLQTLGLRSSSSSSSSQQQPLPPPSVPPPLRLRNNTASAPLGYSPRTFLGNLV